MIARRTPMETIAYRDGETALNGLIARPNGQPRGAVVVFPSIMNQAANATRRLPMLAEAGYVAFLADFYGREPADRADAFALGTALRADVGVYRARIKAAVDTLAALPKAAALPLAAIGYCMGGQAVLEAARMNLPLVLAASFHGILTTDALATDPIRPRILVCHGDADPLVPREQVSAFQAEMDAAEANWHLHVYSGVKHGFSDPEADSHGLPAIGYDASADRQSWAAMLGLLGELTG
jgi:dienelactone hydrolase